MDETPLHLWRLLGALGGTLAMVALTLWLGKQTLLQARGVWLVLRGFKPQVLEHIDEPGDPLITTLAKLTHQPAPIWATFLPAFLRAVADSLDQTLDVEPEPRQAGDESKPFTG